MQHRCCDLAAWEGVNRRECFTVHIYGQMPKKKNVDFDNGNPIPLSKCLMTRVATITMIKQY